MGCERLTAFALPTPNWGYHNQILGAFRALSDLTGGAYDDQAFIWPENVKSIAEMNGSFFLSHREKYDVLKQRIFILLDQYIKDKKSAPHIFITVYDATDNKFSPENIDLACRAVKEYYVDNKLGEVFTTILSSRLHKYKYIDLINIPKHMLTFRARIRLLQDRKLKKRVLVTVGTVNNFNRRTVLEKNNELIEKLKKIPGDELAVAQSSKINKYIASSKKVVLCLGGRVDGHEIIFDINYAQKLLDDAMRLCRCGFGVAIVNGQRTPNDVIDFIYEKTLNYENILFQNCKKIAKDKGDADNWRIYSGKYEEQFRILEQLGNIYPGILGFDNTLVVHSMDSYAGCETANAAFPTAISSKGLYVDPIVRYDCHNLKELLCPKYAIDWDEFVNIADHMGVEPKDLQSQILSNTQRVFAEAVVNRINQNQKTKLEQQNG